MTGKGPVGVRTVDELAAWRSEFPILGKTVYMISNSLGAMPRAAAASLAEYADAWAARGARAWEERWWTLASEVGDRVGQVIGAPPGTVSMHPNVTSAEMTVLSSIRPEGRRRRIVCPEMDFPSMLYLYRAHEAAGFELEVVPAEPDLTVRVERMVEAIDETTALVGMSHVFFRSSYIMDPRPIIERAHAVGAPVILDAFQSAGIIPLDVTELGVDFATGGCLKWLCGGPGNGFLYTRPDLLKTLRPCFTGWLAHRNPFAFETGPIEWREDAMRMMNGTPPIPALYAAIPGLEIITRVGVDRIRGKSKLMTARLLALADEHGYRSVASRDPERLAGTVAIDVPHAREVARTLNARDFVVDYRPGVGIRASPHFYNTFDEIDALVAEIASILGTNAYEDRPGTTSIVT
jgi:kynureninase